MTLGWSQVLFIILTFKKRERDEWTLRRGSQNHPRPRSAAAAAASLQLCLTLCEPMDRGPPGSSVHGILQARILEWVAIPSSRGSSWPRDWTRISVSPALADRFLPLMPPGKPKSSPPILRYWSTRDNLLLVTTTLCQSESWGNGDSFKYGVLQMFCLSSVQCPEMADS